MNRDETNRDPDQLALAALGWTLRDDARAERLLALTGLAPDDIRSRIGDPVLLAAVLRFLEAHEPDLLACAKAIDVPALELVEARRRLEQDSQ
jgi:hypothetical protein